MCFVVKNKFTKTKKSVINGSRQCYLCIISNFRVLNCFVGRMYFSIIVSHYKVYFVI